MIIESNFKEHSDVTKKTLKLLKKKIIKISEIIVICLNNGGKILWCGNGGSATDTIHLSTELVGRFKKNRKPLSSIALASDVGNLTCIANDFGYEKIFSRQIEALGKKNDILISFSTSGKSKNILNAIYAAKKIKMSTITFLGKDGGQCLGASDLELKIPSNTTARIQEMHMLIGHILCDIIEKKLNL